LHCLVTNCALQVQNKICAITQPWCCRVKPSKVRGNWVLELILLLCKGSHVSLQRLVAST
jgi:hypothetical protein